MYFHMKFAFFFLFFDPWYIIKYLLTETSGKQYVLWTLDSQCFSQLRLVNIDSLGSTKHTVSLGLSQPNNQPQQKSADNLATTQR